MLDPTLERRKERYAIAVGVMIANLYTREETLERRHLRWEQGGNGPDEPPRPMIDEQKARALAEGARGVLALMPDFDHLMAMVEPDDVGGRLIGGRPGRQPPAPGSGLLSPCFQIR